MTEEFRSGLIETNQATPRKVIALSKARQYFPGVGKTSWHSQIKPRLEIIKIGSLQFATMDSIVALIGTQQ